MGSASGSDEAAAAAAAAPQVLQWVLDTRSLWPRAEKTIDLTKEAARALALLTADERAEVLRYHFVRDAKLALGSRLLKRLAITRHRARVPWSQALSVRDARTKPVFLLPCEPYGKEGSQYEPLVFNVSHQAGLVVLIAVLDPRPGTAVGVDVVCPSERRARDHSMISRDGWPQFVDMHADVFSRADVTRLKTLPSMSICPASSAQSVVYDRLLAYFYAVWCLREAYVKMTGDALLASWLGDLEMRYFAPASETGPEERPLEIWFKGALVDDLDTRLEPFLDDYMICTVVREGGGEPRELQMDEFENLDLEQVLLEAEAADTRRGHTTPVHDGGLV